MAKGTKPGSKPEAQEEAAEAAPKKSGKKLIVIVIALVLLLAGGAVAAFLLLKPAHPPGTADSPNAPANSEHAPAPAEAAKFLDLGTFTTNLSPEEGDRFIQVAISLKTSRAELEPMIAASKPEIMHRVNMTLQSKLPSDLSSVNGKVLLAEQIKAQIQYVLGLRKTAPPIGSAQTEMPAGEKVKGGLDEVLFTTFLIQ
jgi:flagellar FliL protein